MRRWRGDGYTVRLSVACGELERCAGAVTTRPDGAGGQWQCYGRGDGHDDSALVSQLSPGRPLIRLRRLAYRFQPTGGWLSQLPLSSCGQWQPHSSFQPLHLKQGRFQRRLSHNEDQRRRLFLPVYSSSSSEDTTTQIFSIRSTAS
jgi:hypothetical protein